MNQPSKIIKARGATRREFLKKSTLAGAALAASHNLFKTPVYGQTQAPAPGNAVGANNRIVVGYIGVGLQGTLHINLQKQNAAANNIAQAAVCDVSKHRLAEAKAVIGGDCKDYADFEKLLENKDIDAVTIATVDQWHAGTAMAALQAGKHVYLEKPMSRYLGEAFALYDLAKKNSGQNRPNRLPGLFRRQMGQSARTGHRRQGRQARPGPGILHAQQQGGGMEFLALHGRRLDERQ